MKRSKYQMLLQPNLTKQAVKLYKQGLTMREVGSKLGKSRTWVWRIIQKELPQAFSVTNIDKAKG